MPSTDKRLELKVKDIDGSDHLTAGCVLIDLASPAVSRTAVYANGLIKSLIEWCLTVFYLHFIILYNTMGMSRLKAVLEIVWHTLFQFTASLCLCAECFIFMSLQTWEGKGSDIPLLQTLTALVRSS